MLSTHSLIYSKDSLIQLLLFKNCTLSPGVVSGLPSQESVDGRYKQQTFISPNSGGSETESGMPADPMPGEGSLPGSQTDAFLLCPHRAGREP